MERYLRVNLLGPGPRLMKKRIYRAAVSRRLRNTALGQSRAHVSTSGSFHGFVTVRSLVTATTSLIVTTINAAPKITNDIRSDNFYMLISLLISTYQSTVISWSIAPLISMDMVERSMMINSQIVPSIIHIIYLNLSKAWNHPDIEPWDWPLWGDKCTVYGPWVTI